MKRNSFESKEKLEDELASLILSMIDSHLKENDSVTLLLSGGSTPKEMYKKMFAGRKNWSRIKIGLVDDRMVEETSDFSNAKMIKSIILQAKLEVNPQFYPLVFEPSSPLENNQQLSQPISELSQPFITLLGMGEDGHFASLFPEDEDSLEGLKHENQVAICYTQAPSFPQNRISFTWSFLRKSKNLILFITGEKKISLINSSGNREYLPIDSVISDSTIKPILYWAP